MVNRCPHCDQPLPPPAIRFADLDWLRQLAARDQVPGAETLGPHELLAPDHEQSRDVEL